jgi:benzoyl-CoA reductase/2-hydroxyglutaryl-CoA dehydratase subunit BcrC/BadD/HgdB
MLAQGSGDSGSQYAGYILPTTCDWVSRFKDLMALEGVNLGSAHHLSTPRIKNRHQALEAWHREVWSLGVYLSELSGRRAGRKELKKAVALYRQAYVALSDLLELKRTGRLSQAWLAVILGSFNFDRVEVWTKKTFELAEAVDKISFQSKGEPIFLAGSPMIFPNFKVIRFLEEAGLRVVMDDLCSSERILPGPVHLGDDSLDSIMEALAQRYFLGCLCPTFTDDDRRINNILSPDHQKLYRGVIFHVLKGCHLFDLESLALEGRIKAAGLRFLKIETDHSQEDGPTLLTRLEAYRETLKEVNETSVRN